MTKLNMILIICVILYISYTAYNYIDELKKSTYQDGYTAGFNNATTTRIMYDNAVIIVGNHTLNNSEKSELYIKGTKEIIDNGTTYCVNLRHI